jgi:AcrR family transcriptional regulator
MIVMPFSLMVLPWPAARGKCNSAERHPLPRNTVHYNADVVHDQPQDPEATMASPPQRAADSGPELWFSPPGEQENRRRALTRERVVAEALAVISADGAAALSMRALAARLGVVPGALYRHVRSKEQLCDLVVDGVLADVDCRVDHALAWTEQVKVLARRLRLTLEDHPGIAALLKTREPLGPHSLALAEALLAALRQSGLAGQQTALAFWLTHDYTVGFALSDRTTVNEQRVQDTTTRRQLHAFIRSLPADRFPVLAALGEHVWADNRDLRFSAGLDTILTGLQAASQHTT